MENDIYYTNDIILYIMDCIGAFQDYEKIGTIEFNTKNAIIASPMMNTDIKPMETKGIHLNYAILENIQRGKWEVGEFTFNRPNDVYVIRYKYEPKEKDKIVNRFIESVSGDYGNIGLYELHKKHPNLHFCPNDHISKKDYEIYEKYGITINDDCFGCPDMIASAIISEYKGKIFRVIIIKWSPEPE